MKKIIILVIIGLVILWLLLPSKPEPVLEPSPVLGAVEEVEKPIPPPVRRTIRR